MLIKTHIDLTIIFFFFFSVTAAELHSFQSGTGKFLFKFIKFNTSKIEKIVCSSFAKFQFL